MFRERHNEMKTPADLAWKLMTQLREEVLAAQRIRAQIIGFKITFVTASAGVILAKANDLPIELIALPALAAIFFDSLIGSYGFSIKRIGHYCQHYIEPKLREAVSWPPSDPLWEEFMSKRESRQYLSITGNLGLTTVVTAPALVVLLRDQGRHSVLYTILALAVFFIADILIHIHALRMVRVKWSPVPMQKTSTEETEKSPPVDPGEHANEPSESVES